MKIRSILIGVGLAITLYIILPFGFNATIGTKGNGKVIKQKIEVASFNGIEAGGVFKIFLKKGSSQSVEIETDENIMSKIYTKVKSGELDLSTKGNIRNITKMNVYITVPNIKKLDLSGAARLTTKDRFNEDKLEIELSGASKLVFKAKCNSMNFNISGAANSKISGYTSNINIEASGASSTNFYDMETEKAVVDCSGAANVKLFVRKSLKGEVSGASHIFYKGTPTQVNIETSGAGSVRKK